VGHLVGKDVYKKLGRKLDQLHMRAPWNDKLRLILERIYTPEEAYIVANMPYGIATLGRISRTLGMDKDRLQKLLDGMADKGLVMDLMFKDKQVYAASPIVIGFYEFIMMRAANAETKELAHLFQDYLSGDDALFQRNFGKGQTVGLMRVMPHEDTFEPTTEILDYDKASAVIEAQEFHAIGLCACRHEQTHTGTKQCDYPLETCFSMGNSAEFLVRRGFAKQVSKEAALENVQKSRETGLVLCADNVQKRVEYICHCCSCCCHVLLGINKFGYENAVISSSYIAEPKDDPCNGCTLCAKACPVDAIEMVADSSPRKRKKRPVVKEKACIGCGVCVVACNKTHAMQLVEREARVFVPETIFEKVILQGLDHGNLPNMLFTDVNRLSHRFSRGMTGGFLRLPGVQRTLMSDTMKSRFLNFMSTQAKKRI